MNDIVDKTTPKLNFTGRVSYAEMLQYQRNLFHRRVALKKAGEDSGPDEIIFVEHNPVITLGRHAKHCNLLFSEESLRSRGIEVYEIERGGDVTYHGPGQLVVYPILDLERYRLGVRDYVDMLEEAVIRTLAGYNVIGERVPGASGVWIGKGSPNEKKICAVGVKLSRYITMHGLALNISTDPDAFKVINPCGFTDRGVTSIVAESKQPVNINEVSERLANNLLKLLAEHSK